MVVQKPPTIWNRVYTCAFVANFLLAVSLFMVNPLVANYAKLLGADEVMIGVLSGLYFGVAFAARPFSGPAIAKLNKKHIMLFAYSLGVIVNVGYAISNGVPVFMASRILHGIEFAFVGSLNMTLASESLPAGKMGSGLGLFGIGGATANSIAPSIGMALRSWGEQTFGSLQHGYTVVYIVAAACMLIALIPCVVMPYKKPSREALSRLGAWYKNIFAKESLVPTTVITFMSVSVISYTIYMERFAEARGIGNIGLFFTVYAVALLASRPISGRLIDRYGTARVFIPCAFLIIISFVIIGFGDSLFMILAGAAVAAIGLGGSQPTVQTMSLLSVSPIRYGVASNTVYFGIDFGNFLGPVIAGIIINHYGLLNSFKLSSGYNVTFSPLYLSMVAPMLLALIIFLLGHGAYKRNAAKAREAAQISTPAAERDERTS
jgi:MFS family permease